MATNPFSVDLSRFNNIQLAAHYSKVIDELESRGINHATLTYKKPHKRNRRFRLKKSSKEDAPQPPPRSPVISREDTPSTSPLPSPRRSRESSPSRLDTPLPKEKKPSLKFDRRDWGYTERVIREINNSNNNKPKDRTINIFTTTDVSKEFIRQALYVDHTCVKEIVTIKAKGQEDEESGEDTDTFRALVCGCSSCVKKYMEGRIEFSSVTIGITFSHIQLRSREELDQELDNYIRNGK